MTTIRRIGTALLALCMTAVLPGCSGSSSSQADPPAPAAESTAQQTETTAAESAPATETAASKPAITVHTNAENGTLSHAGYTLEQVVVLSRHNIRSPLSSKDSILGQATPHEWFAWSSAPSELSLRGGAAETVMGQYFRKWMEQENLFPENYRPAENEVRFYANSKQRTIATANYFKAGLLPAADLPVEYHMKFDEMDPVFTPRLNFISDAYSAAVKEQVKSIFTDKINDLSDNYDLISDLIDLRQSPAYSDGTLTGFLTDDTQLVLELEKEPAMKGSLKTACSISDALVLQYYEEPDDAKAAFGRSMTFDDWKKVSEIKDLYGDVLFTAPLVAPNTAHMLLEEMQKELTTAGRKFTFLCGHDSNVGSVLAALGVKEYALPETIESKTPIGCKLVFSKWRDAGGKAFVSCDMVYQSSAQLRDLSLLDLEHAPVIYSMRFDGLEKNADGLYDAKDITDRFASAIAAYDTLQSEYTLDAAA